MGLQVRVLMMWLSLKYLLFLTTMPDNRIFKSGVTTKGARDVSSKWIIHFRYHNGKIRSQEYCNNIVWWLKKSKNFSNVLYLWVPGE